MKETEQTLFLKSNLLHIRTNEGEFEVSNPEILSKSDCFNLSRLNGIEWPGGVEFETIAPHPECYKARECLQLTNGLNCSQAYDARTRSTSICAKAYKLARLIPEEKKDDIQPKRWEESTSIPSKADFVGDSIKAHGINNDLPGHLIEPDFLFPKHTTLGQGYHIKKDYNKLTESAYKEPQDKEQLIGHIIDDFKNHKEIFVEPVSAPSESQEEMWKEVLSKYLNSPMRHQDWKKWAQKHFTITRNP